MVLVVASIFLTLPHVGQGKEGPSALTSDESSDLFHSSNRLVGRKKLLELLGCLSSLFG